MQRRSAIGHLVLAALLWSTNGVLIKLIDWTATGIAGTRSAVAAAVLLLYLRRPGWTGSTAQLGAAVAYAANMILFVLANKTTTAANAILLQYTAPLYVALLSLPLLKEPIRRLDWGVMGAALLGMALFFFDDLTVTQQRGNVWALLSGMSFAAFVLLLRKQKDGSGFESVLLGNVLAALICLPFNLDTRPPPGSWPYLLLLGVVQLGIPYILYTKAVRHVTALEAVVIPYLEPLFNPLWVFLIVGEVPGRMAFIGGALILTAVGTKAFRRPPARRP